METQKNRALGWFVRFVTENWIVIFLIVAAVLLRLMPHPANFAPIGAIALFGGVYLKKNQALWLPLIAMIISDLFIGLHSTIFFTWGSFLLIAVLGMSIRKNRSIGNIFGATVLGSVIFFVVTNFGVWVATPLYAKSVQGLIDCYVMAIPFFRNTLLSDLFYVTAFFGAYELAKYYQQKYLKNHASISA